VDLATQGADATVHATAAGVVTEAQLDGNYGVMVRMRHLLPSGQVVYSQYQHMQYGSLQVYAGEVVRQGQALGLVGATGFATGVHLHFEIKTDDTGGPGYTFGNQAEIAPFFDPLAFVAAHAIRPSTLVTPAGKAIPEFPAEATAVLHRFLQRYQHFVVVTVRAGLYVRSGPGRGYRARGIALRGAKLGYLRRQGDWLYVALPENVRGWVNRTWVTGYQGWSVTWPPKGTVAIVASDGLNIHADPGQQHPVLGICFQGDVVVVGAHTAHWTEVRTREGVHGWVVSRYLIVSGILRARGGGSPTVTVLADVLHVRSGPGTHYRVVGAVFRGTSLPLIRLTPHWAAVILPGDTTGWVARPYTSQAGGRHVAAARGAAAHAVYLRVAAGVVNIRSAPGTHHPVVARALRHTRLQVIGQTAHWAHVALPATTIQGWVLRSLLR
jgi:uncharacterized protein YgiM (DUF1202 family)